MTTFYDVPADLLINALAVKLEENDSITAPDWAEYVKTGITRERPPTQSNWWFIRAAAILRKVGREGPVGVTALSQAYGGYKDNGSMPNTPAAGSRHIIRTIAQQLEEAGFVSMQATKTVESEYGTQQLYAGRVLTPAGQALLNETAHSVRGAAEEQYPGLAKY